MNGKIFTSPVARSIPFDNSTNGFPSSATTVQTAIEQTIHFDPITLPAPLFDDFDGRLSWSPSTSGTGASASISGGNATFASGSHMGVARCAYGTVLSTHAALVWSGALSTAIVMGGGEAEYNTLIRIPTLATATEDYIIRVGLGTATNADHANGIYFEYARASSINWRCRTASASSRTTLTTSTAVVNNAWINLRWVCNAAGTSVEFFIDSVSQGTITTNIPTTTGQGCGGNFQITAQALVSGGGDFVIDWFYFSKAFTSRS